jgi:hypothetical protein
MTHPDGMSFSDDVAFLVDVAFMQYRMAMLGLSRLDYPTVRNGVSIP